MSIKQTDFAGDLVLTCKKFLSYPNVNAELGVIASALGADTTSHDRTVEAAAVALRIHNEQKTPFTNQVNLLINKGKAGNLPNASMVAAIDAVAGVAFAPGVVDIPYASANASPPIVGTVCSVTNGNWVGSPTGYTYQWCRDGANIGAATAATYTLVSADTGGHKIQCKVTATNVTGSTTAPLSNGIQVP